MEIRYFQIIIPLISMLFIIKHFLAYRKNILNLKQLTSHRNELAIQHKSLK